MDQQSIDFMIDERQAVVGQQSDNDDELPGGRRGQQEDDKNNNEDLDETQPYDDDNELHQEPGIEPAVEPAVEPEEKKKRRILSHVENLSRLCRVCGATLLAGTTYCYPVLGWAAKLEATFGGMFSNDDPDVHPQKFCARCHSSIGN